jgi:two-component system chemotaxis response regulator CheB
VHVPDRIIVMGASLGGVPALMQIASVLPDDLPAPVLIVLHVGQQPSILPSLLAANSRLPAAHARHGQEIRPGHLYVAPPDHHMLVVDGRIVLTRGAREHHTRPAIDPLFRSAALAFRQEAIGVVLTGQLDDGTAGLQAIKEHGGLAVVQDPEDAFASSMPLSALRYVEVDHCVPLGLIPMLLTTLASAPPRSPPAASSERSGHEQRTLQQAMAEANEEAVSNAMRTLQEREILLRQMADQRRANHEERAAAGLESAAGRLHRQYVLLKALQERSPEPIE